MALHRLEQDERADEVVLVVAEGDGDRLADGLETGEVDDGVELRPGEDLIDRCLVDEVRLDERGGLAGELRDAAKRLRLAVDEVVDYGDVESLRKQLHYRMAADEPGATCDQDIHG